MLLSSVRIHKRGLQRYMDSLLCNRKWDDYTTKYLFVVKIFQKAGHESNIPHVISSVLLLSVD